MSGSPHKFEEDGYYYFLTGLLGSQFDGARSFVTVYGFTEILPGRVTVDRIVSTDGNTYFILNKGWLWRVSWAYGLYRRFGAEKP